MKDFDRSCSFKSVRIQLGHGLRLIIYTDWFIRFNCLFSFKVTSSEVLIVVEMNTSLEGNHGLFSGGFHIELIFFIFKNKSFRCLPFFRSPVVVNCSAETE